jgi:hypothetical protein
VLAGGVGVTGADGVGGGVGGLMSLI